MRKALAFTAAIATSGLFFALPASPAAASGFEGSGDGQGSYTVQVTVTGSGVGTGGSLGQGAVNSSGGSVTVPSPCGYESAMTQQEIEAGYGGDKSLAAAQHFGPSGPDATVFPVSVPWQQGILDNWGKQGTWYIAGCDGTNWDRFAKFAKDNQPVLVGPGGGGPPQPKLDPKFLEEIAIKAMTLPKPAPGHNPSADAGQSFVNVPGGTWFWATWKAPMGVRSVSATAQGVSATATALFQGTTFTSSGGAAPNSVFCRDGGKPYTRGATASACNLNYVASSGRGSYTVTAASRWTASVTSPLGTRGLPGATMLGTSAVRVGEIQTINR